MCVCVCVCVCACVCVRVSSFVEPGASNRSCDRYKATRNRRSVRNSCTQTARVPLSHLCGTVHLNPRVSVLPSYESARRTEEGVVTRGVRYRFGFEIHSEMVAFRHEGGLPQLSWGVGWLVVAVRSHDSVLLRCHFEDFSEAVSVVGVKVPSFDPHFCVVDFKLHEHKKKHTHFSKSKSCVSRVWYEVLPTSD